MKPTLVYSVLFFALIAAAIMVDPNGDLTAPELTSTSATIESTANEAAPLPSIIFENSSIEANNLAEPFIGLSSDSRITDSAEALSAAQGAIEPKTLFEEIDFAMELKTSDTHDVAGIATSSIGEMVFASQLKPNNEVVLSLNLMQVEDKAVEMRAYFDLANFTMELDGANAVLNKEHKLLMEALVQQLGAEFESQYKDYDFPEHALMLLQMLSYWSVSPEGYVHEKREIVAKY